MVNEFVSSLKTDSENATLQVAKAQLEMKTRQEKKQDNVLDSDLNQMIHSIKNGQGWQTRGAEKMTYIDKMLMFGMMDYQPS